MRPNCSNITCTEPGFIFDSSATLPKGGGGRPEGVDDCCPGYCVPFENCGIKTQKINMTDIENPKKKGSICWTDNEIEVRICAGLCMESSGMSFDFGSLLYNGAEVQTFESICECCHGAVYTVEEVNFKCDDGSKHVFAISQMTSCK